VAKKNILDGLNTMWSWGRKKSVKDTEAEHAPLESSQIAEAEYEIPDDEHLIDELEKNARRKWKDEHPEDTIKRQRLLYETGAIAELPWMHADYRTAYQDQLGLEADNRPEGLMGEVRGFGTAFPPNPNKSDMFLRVDQLPSVLYKFNGKTWIEVDKSQSDTHAYNDAYIDHLIEKISTGEYDIDLLSDAERDSIEQRLRSTGQA
jgi:hypothetical protein